MTRSSGLCFGLDVCCLCSPPPNLHVENLALNKMVLGGMVWGRCPGHEGGALINGISTLIKETPLAPFHYVMTQRSIVYNL